jgi:hypothetical protein
MVQNRRVGSQGEKRIDDAGPNAVLDVDQIDRVLGQVTIGRDDDGHRLAHISDPPHRDGPTFHGRLYPDDETGRQRFHVVPGQYGRDAVRSPSGHRVNPDDVGMGMGRAQDRSMQRVGASPEIVDETPTSRQQSRIFDASYRLPTQSFVG